MKKHWIITFLTVVVSTYFIREIYIEKRIYLDLTRDCSVYKGKDQKQFMSCWRAKRNARYSLKKRLGDYEKKLVEKDR